MLLKLFEWFSAWGVLEILVLACVFYAAFRFLQGTRSAQVLTGLVLVLLFLFAITRLFHFDALHWLLSKLSVYLAIAFLIIFQPEIRRALAELGRPHVLTGSSKSRSDVVDSVVTAVCLLAERRIGALIAIEREIGTKAVQDTGIGLDSKVVPELLATIFFPHTPLHDGGVIIRGDRIVAAGCLFPPSDRAGLSKTMGMRHRAAVGLSEETDAVVVVVSEESGTISVGYRGRLSQDLNSDRLRRFLATVLTREQKGKSSWERAKEQLDLTFEGIARSEGLDDQESAKNADQ